MGMSHMQWFQIRPPHGWQRQVAEYEDSRDTIINFYKRIKDFQKAAPETHTERQVTQHGCLPSNNGIEIVYGEEKYSVLGRLHRAANAEKKYLAPA
jgi:hypothetical protein